MANKYIDSTLLDKALIFAVNAHANTERRGKGFPYIVHVLEAVEIVASMTNDQELLAAAALHDTIEDTDVTYEQLRAEFGERIASLVDAESDKFEEGVSEEASWHQRKQAAIDRIAAAPLDAKMVALGDKLSNMRAIARDYEKLGDNLWKIFHADKPSDHEWHYRGLAASLAPLADTFAYKEFVSLIKKVFDNAGQRVVPALVDMNDYVESGDGFTAISYNHKDGKTMIKLYSDFIGREEPIREQRVGQRIGALGIHTPSVGRVITDGKRIGVEFERISPKRSFARAISQEPENLEMYAVRFAKRCKELHSIPCDTVNFTNVKDYFSEVVNKCALLTDQQKVNAKKFIDDTPTATTCLHGDMHIGNIITNGEQDWWIDLSDFRYGNPLFDFGMFYFVCCCNPDEMTRHLYHIGNEQMQKVWSIVIREYFPGQKLEDVNEMIKPYTALFMMSFVNKGAREPWVVNMAANAFL